MAAFLDNVCFDTIIADCQRQCLELFPPRSLRVQRPSFDSGNWGRVFHASIDGQHEPMVLKIMSWPLDNREFLAQQEAHSKMAHPTAPIRVPNVYYLFHPSYYMQPVPFAALLMDLIPDTRPTSRQSLAGESHIQATLRPAPNVHDLLLLLDVPGTLLHSPYKRYKLMHDILLAVQELLPLAHLDLLVPNILVQENADGSLLPAFIDWAFTAHLVSYNNSYEMTLMPHPQQDSPAQNDYRMMIGSLKGTMLVLYYQLYLVTDCFQVENPRAQHTRARPEAG